MGKRNKILAFGRGACYNSGMIVSDMHTHSSFSADGRSTLTQMAEAGRSRGLRFLGVSEHLDVDPVSEKLFQPTDVPAYFSAARELQKENGPSFTLLAGLEYGYSPDARTLETLLSVSEKYAPDFVVNSVHVADGEECSRAEYFRGKSKRQAYSAYLEQVLNSLDAPYFYDVIGHLGYVSRKAPYEDKTLRYEDFRDLLDEILKKAIARGKLLEVNTRSRLSGSPFLPGPDILARYHELGGRLISFGSDAHDVSFIAAGREDVAATLQELGFDAVAVPARGRVTLLPLK